MATVPLYEFIGVYRDELIRRCKEKVASRSAPPPPTAADIDHGVPLFLDQLVLELRGGPSSTTSDITSVAAEHGRELLLKGFTVSQVVHDYGDVCQAVTDLAVEMDAPIDTEDFRTMNRCLDNAIASAVTEHARGQQTGRDSRSAELQTQAEIAIRAFEALLTGSVGIAGRTGDVLHRALKAIRALADASSAKKTATPEIASRQIR